MREVVARGDARALPCLQVRTVSVCSSAFRTLMRLILFEIGSSPSAQLSMEWLRVRAHGSARVSNRSPACVNAQGSADLSKRCASCVCSFDGIAKLDVTAPAGKGWVDCLKVPGYTIGEPFYVPRDADALRKGVAADPYFATDNDDGWLLAWTIHKASGKCQCLVRAPPHDS